MQFVRLRGVGAASAAFVTLWTLWPADVGAASGDPPSAAAPTSTPTPPASAAPAPPLDAPPVAPPASASSAAAPPPTTPPPAPSPGAPSPPSAAGPAPAFGAPGPDAFGPPAFSADPIGAAASAADLTLKMYGDTGFAIRNNANQPWPVQTANANVYAPGVYNSFYAPRIDLFGSADVNKVTFLTEVMFEAANNGITVDVERAQLSYLVANWLRLRVGRSHLAWGYYNDSYHHGNLFELTTSRPYSVNFEDSFGIVLAHNVGVGADGTFDFGDAGALRYDVEVGNGRAPDVTSVALQFATKNEKAVNLRLRYMPIDGLIVGINGMRDVVPSLAGANGAFRPDTEELVGGAHVVYTENHVLLDVEAFAMRHNPYGGPSTNIYGGFAEGGYTIGAFTPYARGEYMRFPASGDVVYQYSSDSAQGQLTGESSIYFGIRDFFDLRIGVKWLPIPQVALKLEGERLARDGQDQEIATAKVAYGF